MKSKTNAAGPSAIGIFNRFGSTFLLLGVVLAILFFRSLLPGMVVFSNDGPLGANVAEQFHMPTAFTGVWTTLNWVGNYAGASAPNITNTLLWLLGPVGFAKFYAPFSVLVLGLCAWLAFRQMRFSPVACATGALAAALNGGFFSYACWGLGTLALTIASFFLALAAWGSEPEKRSWLRVILSGFAIGLGIMEGFDNGAILSLFFAAYVLVRTWVENPGQPKRLTGGVVRLAVLAIMAGVFASHALYGLITTQIQGVAGMAQDETTKQKRWVEATMWSLPKAETMRLFVAGLYGYRMDTPDGGAYWGAVGRNPVWDEYLAQDNPDPNQAPSPTGQGLRFSGSGFYCGVFVCLLALWALFRSFGNAGSLYRRDERWLIRFWGLMAFISLLLSWGKYGSVYGIAYQLPYFSTIRNPIKFLHPLNISIIILFAYGLEGVLRCWVNQSTDGIDLKKRFGNWWRTSRGFDRYWIVGCVIFFGASIFATVLYGSMKEEMTKFLQVIGPANAAMAAKMFNHSLVEILWSLLFFAAGSVVIALMMSGAIRRSTAWNAGVIAVLLITGLDLARSNLPWIQHYDYKTRYASTPLYDFLAKQPWEHRAQMLPGVFTQQQFASLQSRVKPQQLQQLLQMYYAVNQAYGVEWLQHEFQYYNIQSLDIVQEPRPTIENQTYRAHFPQGDPKAQLRLARLTNSRYFLGLGNPVLKPLNDLAASEGGQFREVMSVWPSTNQYPRPTQNTNLPFALIEYTGALPRVGLYANWQVENDSSNVLQRLTSSDFDPGKQVLVEGDCPAPANPDAADAGTVEITNYHPKLVEMKANVKVPAVLLFNDKHDPNWHVWVDGQPATMLKANYLMRGLHLPPGEHQITWRFQPPTTGLYISVAAIFAGFLMIGVVVAQSKKDKEKAQKK
ncbi:hypothetical protein GC207_03330 [bacterium]|nr:hypothetical protein [bacterium]